MGTMVCPSHSTPFTCPIAWEPTYAVWYHISKDTLGSQPGLTLQVGTQSRMDPCALSKAKNASAYMNKYVVKRKRIFFFFFGPPHGMEWNLRPLQGNHRVLTTQQGSLYSLSCSEQLLGDWALEDSEGRLNRALFQTLQLQNSGPYGS